MYAVYFITKSGFVILNAALQGHVALHQFGEGGACFLRQRNNVNKWGQMKLST
jgi:hypothetical protein